MQIFKTKVFARFARRESIGDSSLYEAADRAQRGLIDADLTGGLIKQRVARTGEGRSGGYRVLLAFRSKDRTIFIYGFAKNDRDNLDDKELATVRQVAESWLAADAGKIKRALEAKLLIEVKNDGKDKNA